MSTLPFTTSRSRLGASARWRYTVLKKPPPSHYGASRPYTRGLAHIRSTTGLGFPKSMSVPPLYIRRAAPWLQPPFLLRFSSTETPKKRFSIVRFLRRSIFLIGFFVATSSALVLAFFIYDATTYSGEPLSESIPISSIALNPRKGGPKKLPIAEYLIDDDDSPESKSQKHKPKLVILGTGWGSVALLKELNPDDYHVTVVSPNNTFLFTPMLPSATVGTLELRSLVEPVRRIVQRVDGHFLKGIAEDVEFSEKLVEISGVGQDGKKQNFYLPYDKLVIATGQLCLNSMFCFLFKKALESLRRSNRLRHKPTWCQRASELPLSERYR